MKYPHLSAGYVGVKSNNATLNSYFFYTFFNEIINDYQQLSNILLLPQRVPRIGFLKELLTLETRDFKNKYHQTIGSLKTAYYKSLKALMKNANEANARQYINWCNVLSRYGLFHTIINTYPRHYQGPYVDEIEILYQQTQIELNISYDEMTSIDNLLNITKKYIHSAKTSERTKISILTNVIVIYYRYQKTHQFNREISTYCQDLISLLESFYNTTFLNTYYSAIAFRGLAMGSEFNQDQKQNLLEKAEHLSRNIKSTNRHENILAKENLYTCLQTLSKWCLNQNKIEPAERYLKEMIKLDPYDSTAYTELAFLYSKKNASHEAAFQFKNAMDLGPPGTAMNAYYYALSLEKIGKELEAVQYLEHSALLDKQAISPQLDLLNYFYSKKNFRRCRKIAKHIFSVPVLKEQLNESEMCFIKDFFE